MEADKEKFLFRRQYILGPRYIDKFSTWEKIEISETLFITVHPDLEWAQSEYGDINLTLLGFIIDPFNPEYSNMEVLSDINRNITCFSDLIYHTNKCGGRWIIVYNDGLNNNILHDACGFRQVFYYRTGDILWCGSQPSIIVDALDLRLEEDKGAMEFIKSSKYQKNERFWLGDDTVYKEIKHLMPNHYINLKDGKVTRYWPSEKLYSIDLKDAVRIASDILKGLLKGAANRYELQLAVTAGVDSRTLLAASRDIKEKIFYYVNMHGDVNEEHPDVKVPARLLPALGLKFNIMKSENYIDDSFIEIFDRNVTMARHIPKTYAIYHNFKHSKGRLNICGNVSEIARCNHYGNSHRNITGSYLAAMLWYKNTDFVISALDKWLEESYEVSKSYGIDILDIFQWEQRMGNWGAMYPAEQDIAMEEFCPFNNRSLLVTLLSMDEKYRKPKEYILYRELIKNMWEEALKEPMNPANIKKKLRNLAKKVYIKLRVYAHSIKHFFRLHKA